MPATVSQKVNSDDPATVAAALQEFRLSARAITSCILKLKETDRKTDSSTAGEGPSASKSSASPVKDESFSVTPKRLHITYNHE